MKELIPDVLTWLDKAGWNDEIQRSLDFTRAEICCRAGEEHYLTGLVIYSGLLQAGFHRNFDDVLKGLTRFPREFWPAHQLELEIFTQLTPDYYPQVFARYEGSVRRIWFRTCG